MTYDEYRNLCKKAASSWRELNDMTPEDAWNTFNGLTQSWAAMTPEEATKAATAFYDGITADDLAKQTGHMWSAASQEFKDGILSQYEDFSPEDRAEILKRMGISEETEPEPVPEGPVRSQVNTDGPVKVMAGSTNPKANVDQMAADAKSNFENPRTANGKRYGRNLVGSPYVTKAGFKPGNRERITPPANAQAATTHSAPPANRTTANPTNPTTDSRGLTPGATTGKVETAKPTTGPDMTTYKDAYTKTKTPTPGVPKTASLFGLFDSKGDAPKRLPKPLKLSV